MDVCASRALSLSLQRERERERGYTSVVSTLKSALTLIDRNNNVCERPRAEVLHVRIYVKI